MIISYTVPEIRHMTEVIVIFHSGQWAIFCPFTSITDQKFKIKNNEENAWRCHHFTYVYQKLWSDDVRFLRYSARQTDGQTDRKGDI